MKRNYISAILALLIGAFPFAGLAAEEPAGEKPTPAAVVAAAPQVEAAADDKTKEAGNKAEEKAEEPLEPLMSIDGSPLTDADFTMNSFGLSEDIQDLTAKGGMAKSISHHGLTDTYEWDGMTVTSYNPFLAKYMNRPDLPLSTQVPAMGICAFSITGKDYLTTRGLHVGSRRENVLRRYGRPSQVLWDGAKGTFYFRYVMDKKELSFTIAKDKVAAIRIGWNEKRPEVEKPVKDSLPDTDFHLAGFSVDEEFKAHPFQDWEKKMTNPKEEIWYYPGYAVRETAKEHLIRALFITDAQMVTSRGLTMGDDSATVDLLYGAPQKVEADNHEAEPRTTYVYFSRDKRNVLLIYLKNHVVDGVIVAENPQNGHA